MEGEMKNLESAQEAIDSVNHLMNTLNQVKYQLESDDFDREAVDLHSLNESLKEYSRGLEDFPKKK